MSKWALFFILILIAVGLMDKRYGLEPNPPRHQYIWLAAEHRWIHVNVSALYEAPEPPKPPVNKPPTCLPGVTCGCQYIFHCTQAL